MAEFDNMIANMGSENEGGMEEEEMDVDDYMKQIEGMDGEDI